MEDSPRVGARRVREMRVVSQMVALYCAAHHDANVRTHTAHCGESVCVACAQADAYAVARTQGCRKMDQKVTCEACENHCYKPSERERIREIMRYAGPRMMKKHPVAAIRHVLGK